MKRHRSRSSIPYKANRVLNVVLLGMFCILVRVWHLGVASHEEELKIALKPRKKMVVQPATRATIRDRFNVPLATNVVKYQAGVCYAPIKEIPIVRWKDGERVSPRRDYIQKLSELLGAELELSPERIDDLIHAKAVFYNNLPYILKDEISEGTYYRLKALERKWPGLIAVRVPKRVYPKGKVAADVVGTLGAINRREYEAILGEMAQLREEMFENPAAESRLKELEERIYSQNDLVGKMGIESRFEETLRGYFGKRYYDTDAGGRILGELSGGRDPIQGQRLLLTISSELQERAENLLLEYDEILEKASHYSVEPWMRGGAIVAMDPRTGEVLALASSPRFDPNDFSTRNSSHIERWFEGEAYLEKVWEQREPLMRERIVNGQPVEEGENLTWDAYLSHILPVDHPVRKELDRTTVGQAAGILRDMEMLLALSQQRNMVALVDALFDGVPFEAGRGELDKYMVTRHLTEEAYAIQKRIDLKRLPRNDHKIMFLDLCRLLVTSDTKHLHKMPLREYREIISAFSIVNDAVKKIACNQYHIAVFSEWRKENGKSFLKEKRANEREKGLWARPYIDYFDREEKRQFNEFWRIYRLDLLNAFLKGERSNAPFVKEFLSWHNEIMHGAHRGMPWVESHLKVARHAHEIQLDKLRRYQELNRPLWGRYRNLRSSEGKQLEKHLATAFYPKYGYGFAKSYSYREGAAPGSVFKLVTAHEALIQRYERGLNLNPFEMLDQPSKHSVGAFLNGSTIPIQYKGGVMIRSLSRYIGQTDLVRALSMSSNPYFSILAGEYLHHPNDLARAAEDFGFGHRTGIDLPGEMAGRIPDDFDSNRSGLYAAAIGQHSLVATPLQTAVLLSAVANGGKVLQPKIVKLSIGADLNGPEQVIYPVDTVVHHEVLMPPEVQEKLHAGMRGVIERLTPARLGGIHPQKYLSDYRKIYPDLRGKTSSAEVMEQLHIDRLDGVYKCTHSWFGGFSVDEGGNPELVVVVFLKHGGLGNRAVPIAAQIVKKWREIRQ